MIAGNERFFSAGADLREIAALDAPSAYEFSKMGQALMSEIESFPAPVYAAISGYCMGGGLDLALACHHRIASPHAVFGHRGAALGLITGWGGTQRLPRLIGRAEHCKCSLPPKNSAPAMPCGLDWWTQSRTIRSLKRFGEFRHPNLRLRCSLHCAFQPRWYTVKSSSSIWLTATNRWP